LSGDQASGVAGRCVLDGRRLARPVARTGGVRRLDDPPAARPRARELVAATAGRTLPVAAGRALPPDRLARAPCAGAETATGRARRSSGGSGEHGTHRRTD